MKRTPLRERILPAYLKKEETFNMVSHIVGGGIGVVALIICLIVAIQNNNVWGLVGSAVYGITMIALYAFSSIYHGLPSSTAKRVFQVLDHCAIYFMIAGTYTPIVLSAIRPIAPVWAWAIFGVEWGLTALAASLTAVDLKKYKVFSMICYMGMGWLVVFAWEPCLNALGVDGMTLLMTGGMMYVIGAVFYGIGKRKPYIHGVFHLCVVLGSVLQFFSIVLYAL